MKIEMYFNEDGSPKKCTNCKSTNFEWRTIDTIDYTICESEIVCKDCDKTMGYWAYGYYEQDFMLNMNEKEGENEII